MKYLGVLLLVLVSQEFCMAITVPNEVTRVDRFQHPSYNGVSMKPVFPFRRQDDDNSSNSNISISNDDSSSSDGKSQDLQIPTINFYSTIPNAIGVVGQGFLWIREIFSSRLVNYFRPEYFRKGDSNLGQ
ncbi:hypothetical protein Ocin01_07371 [Orchesella cincta]|uniref:Uncharacterized protein n=1 Tax=Orchesella cincta TaxID=48709 RepID=A0A1D2N222_ORCCI|nr:hypothetical protein Ocin01_07371 [Orchesella cincta]